jgi:hypothetical protein
MTITGPLTIDSIPSVSWKDGGGTTRTLAMQPEGAGLDDFVWRISLAEIHASGSFSKFAGIERTILLWSGRGVVLRSPSWPDHPLTELREPFTFAGEKEVICEMVGGLTTDLNVMVRRGAAHAIIRTESTKVRLSYPNDDVVILCAVGRAHVELDDGSMFTLDGGQFLSIVKLIAGVIIIPQGPAATFVYAVIHSLN